MQDEAADPKMIEFAASMLEFLECRELPAGAAGFFLGVGAGMMVRAHASDGEILVAAQHGIDGARAMLGVLNPPS